MLYSVVVTFASGDEILKSDWLFKWKLSISVLLSGATFPPNIPEQNLASYFSGFKFAYFWVVIHVETYM